MNDQSADRYAERVRSLAGAFLYPTTPDLAGARQLRLPPVGARRPVLRRRLALVAIVILVAAASLLAVPQARAAVVRLIRIGVVRIFLTESPPAPGTQAPAPPVTATPASIQDTDGGIPVPTSTASLGSALDELSGETKLEQAQSQAAFRIRLPTYPSDLGPPDRVFLQDQGGSVVILAWLSPDDPETVRLTLHELSSDSWGNKKVQLQAVTTTTVDGHPAVWAVGPYILIYRNGDLVQERLVEGHVLIWESARVTYRVESDLTLEEAIQVAESLE